jgi:hypothetical protein
VTMEFIDHMLGSEGCNVDGTISANPFTSFMQQVFENHHNSFDGSATTDTAAQIMFSDSISTSQNITHNDFSQVRFK